MTRPLRVVSLATNDVRGGAARSAYRLHLGLREAGVDARMLVRWKHSDDPTVALAEVVEPEECRTLRRRWARDNRSGRTDTLFSLPVYSASLAAHPLVRDADIVHLHWVANFLGSAGIAEIAALGKPIAWTLHDEWAYTGGCHYTAGCMSFAESGCAACPQLRDDPLGLVARAFAERCAVLRAATVAVVAPSRWLTERARQSEALGHCASHTIPYGLDATLFAPCGPEARSAFRAAHGISSAAFVLAFGVDRLAERRKGLEHLHAALALVRHEVPSLVALRFGDATGAEALPVPTVDLGPISDDRHLALAYGAADLFALPTLEDNLPNGALESLSCGTPVVAYETGGIPDVIDHGTEGLLAPAGDVAALARNIVAAARSGLRLRDMGRAGRARVVAQHTLAVQAGRYMQLYAQLGGRAALEAVA